VSGEKTVAKGGHLIAWVALALMLVLMPTLMPISAFAQSTSPTPAAIAEEGLRRQQERDARQQAEQQPKADVLVKPKPKAALADLVDELPCFVVTDITLEGPGKQRFYWLLKEAAPYLNRCTGAKGLQSIAEAFDAALLGQGYATTRVALPAQNLREGRLALTLYVGHVSEIRMVRSAAGQLVADERWGTWRNAFPVSKGDRLNVRDLEQGVEQMKRLPSQNVSTRLEPGNEPDTSVIVIERETADLKDRVHGGLTLDNSGSASLGRTQASANVALDNALGLNDVLNLGFNSNAENSSGDHRSRSFSLGYSVPWGYSTWSLNTSRNEFAQRVQGTTATFLSSGQSESSEIRWQHLLMRTASSKTGFFASVSSRRASSFLDDVELIVQQRHTTNIETGVTHRQLIGDAAIDLDLSYRRGTSLNSAQEDLAGAEAGGLTLRPRLWAYNASVALPLKAMGRDFQWSSTLHGQRTNDNTLSIDQIALGGRGSVRGFDGDRVLIAECGWFVRNELVASLKPIDGVDLSAYVALDAGRVWGPSDVNLVGHALAGSAVGVRGRYRSLRLDAAIGVPIHKPEGFVTASVAPYVSAILAF
jgi:hemolysin activation/secretion protein